MQKLLTLLPSRTAAYAIRKRTQPKFGLREEEFVQNYHRPGTTALCYDCLLQCFSTFVRPRPGKFFFLQDEGPVPTNFLSPYVN